MKLKASNCHVLNMNSIRGFSRTSSKFYIWPLWIFRTPILEHTYWWLLLYVIEALVFQNTSKWMLSSLSNRAIFFSEYFYLKNHPKTHTFILTSMRTGSSITRFWKCFHHYFLRRHSSKTFLYWRNIKIFISLQRHFQR